MKNAAACWCAPLLALLIAVPAGAAYIDHFTVPDDIGRNKIPRDGTRPVLVIRIEVAEQLDWSATESFFDPQGTSDGFTRYWEVNSLGAYRPEAELPDPIHFESCPMPPPHDDCAIDRGDITALVPAMRMLAQVLARVDQEGGVDFTQLDSNGDGWTDGVLAIINTEVGGIALPIFELIDKFPNLFDAADFTFDGVRVNSVAIAERRDFRNYLHEFGHVLGFDDMYNEGFVDVDDPDRDLEPNPGSAHSLMGSGYDRHTMLNAVDRVRIGWAEIVLIDRLEQAMLAPPVAETGVVYQLGTGPEHFLIENRRPPEPDDPWYPFDDGLPGEGGLAIYRMLESKQPSPDLGIIGRVIECPNCNEFEPFIFFEQADALFEMQSEEGFFARNDPADFFTTGDALEPTPDNTAPLARDNLVLRSNLLDGTVTNAAVRDIDSESAAPDVIVTLLPVTQSCNASVAGGGAGPAGLLPLLAGLAALSRRAARPRVGHRAGTRVGPPAPSGAARPRPSART